jgi:hypothetical protein
VCSRPTLSKSILGYWPSVCRSPTNKPTWTNESTTTAEAPKKKSHKGTGRSWLCPNPCARAGRAHGRPSNENTTVAVRMRRNCAVPLVVLHQEHAQHLFGLMVLNLEAPRQIPLEQKCHWLTGGHLPLEVVTVNVDLERLLGS